MNVTPAKKMCQARYLTPHNDHGFSVFVIPDQRAIASAEPESSTTAKTQSVLFLVFKGKRLRLFTVALDTGSAFANAHLSGMTMYRNCTSRYATRRSNPWGHRVMSGWGSMPCGSKTK